MAYSGYLFKVGNFTIPLSMMSHESYKVTKNDQDNDSYRDGNGVLHRNALTHYSVKVEFEIPPMKKNVEIESFFNSLYAQFGNSQDSNANATEKSATCIAYVPELRGYHTGKMYLNSSVEFPIYRATSEFIQYQAIRLAFIEY